MLCGAASPSVPRACRVGQQDFRSLIVTSRPSLNARCQRHERMATAVRRPKSPAARVANVIQPGGAGRKGSPLSSVSPPRLHQSRPSTVRCGCQTPTPPPVSRASATVVRYASRRPGVREVRGAAGRRPAHAGEPGPGSQVDDLKTAVAVPEWKPTFMPPRLRLGTVLSETIDVGCDVHTHLAMLDDALHGERSRFREDVRPLCEAVVSAQRLSQFRGKQQAEFSFGSGDGFLGRWSGQHIDARWRVSSQPAFNPNPCLRHCCHWRRVDGPFVRPATRRIANARTSA